jgi:hypothetical protein
MGRKWVESFGSREESPNGSAQGPFQPAARTTAVTRELRRLVSQEGAGMAWSTVRPWAFVDGHGVGEGDVRCHVVSRQDRLAPSGHILDHQAVVVLASIS